MYFKESQICLQGVEEILIIYKKNKKLIKYSMTDQMQKYYIKKIIIKKYKIE